MSVDFSKKYQAEFDAGLKHVGEHVQDAIDRKIDELCPHLIETNTGDSYACVLTLIYHSLAQGMLAWFRDKNLEQFKQHIYEMTKLERIAFHYTSNRQTGEDLYLGPLLADNKELLNWFTSNDLMPTSNRHNPRQHSFRWSQMMYSLRGDWTIVEERAQKVIAMAPPAQKKYMLDEHFYLALARGDLAGMEATLSELTSPKVARVRNNEFGFAYTRPFIGTHAVMYAKLAWLHGHQVKIDTPYIPQEWLPVAPLSTYKDPYNFMRTFDIHEPLARTPDTI
ncbi:Imm49 family immunity protein [Verminephrobacter aporrectodeae]|uniref:Imm49 family immunity protein n=1 Tax=Verminephrobacter aporrectodeae TaxID=1110389 RepID=UPI002243E732|nr:Imm49 family immunity protein [Verminephrobacter aporrectodeae]MCW8174351.1 hypothetical protein [Verminephrobacter aporrectodeae subsp. tuberculatae]MCW8197321.1 hypothetical protein [Verminephrobacter aporrectodeae subsp. tuberculatae]MCW8202104.1 hypothetical protein [Verminephrobacter aporrectodeae subsp. tuberculatae]